MHTAPPLTLTDPTLRDGAHACSHQISEDQLRRYCQAIDRAGIDYVEVGHGNGLGASSLQLGESLLPEVRMLQIARETLRRTRLSVHVMPGFATIDREIASALDCGVDLFRVASHCTEADITQRHIAHVRNQGREVWGVLMMTHMADANVLLDEAQKMRSYGAQGIVLMDSAGAFLPKDVEEKVGLLVDRMDVPIGFHAHNNLGMAVANSLAAVASHARILDGTARGFGAGAGNAPLELLVAVLERLGYRMRVKLYPVLDAAELAAEIFAENLPVGNAVTIVSGLTGVFSGFAKPVIRVSRQLNVDPRDVFFELGRRKVVGGQEDLILEIATALAKSRPEKSGALP